MPKTSRRQPLAKTLKTLPCLVVGCRRTFVAQSGRTQHMNTFHADLSGHRRETQSNIPRSPTPTPLDEDVNLNDPQSPRDDDHGAADREPVNPPPALPQKIKHPYLTSDVCDETGVPLPPGVNTPPPISERSRDDFAPFEDGLQFCIADFLYRREEMAQTKINTLLHYWGLSLMKHGATFGPFNNYTHLFNTIDEIEQGDAPWQCLQVEVQETINETSPSWKKKTYEVWYRDPDTVLSNMLSNPDFKGEFDYQPYVEVDEKGNRRWSDFMSGNHAWKQSDRIFEENEANRGATYVSIILGSDKTTVSVATGDIEYHPLYLSIGNVHNNVRRAHRNAVVPIAFLAIPKGERRSDDDPDFRRFKRQLYHSSISAIFASIRPHMSTPVVRRFPDGHFRRVVYDFGAFIADYPEQVMLAGIVVEMPARLRADITNYRIRRHASAPAR